jgi:hypothetical protein
VNYASQEKDHQEENNCQKENNQKTEKDILLCPLRNRNYYKQGGDGCNQTDVLWPADEKEESLLISGIGLENYTSPARIHNSILKFDEKDVIQILDKLVRLL